MIARAAEEAAVALLAVQFLTRLPVPARHTPERMAAVPRWLPGVGLGIGALCGGVLLLAAQIWPPALAALAAVAAGLALTGALHEDGLADCCDGLGGGASAERALEIMRDSRIGSYGAAGLGLVLAARVLALAALAPPLAALALVAGHGASRAAVAHAIATMPYARQEGAGSAMPALGTGGLALALATGGAGLAALLLVAPPGAVAAGLFGLLAGAALIRRWLRRRLGGYTGDGLGAIQQAAELGLYLGLAAWP